MYSEQISPIAFDKGIGWSITGLPDLTTDWTWFNVIVDETFDSLSIWDSGPGVEISSSRQESPSKLLRKESNSFLEPKNEILSLRRSNVVSCDGKWIWNEVCRSREERLTLSAGNIGDKCLVLGCAGLGAGATSNEGKVPATSISVGIDWFKVRGNDDSDGLRVQLHRWPWLQVLLYM